MKNLTFNHLVLIVSDSKNTIEDRFKAGKELIRRDAILVEFGEIRSMNTVEMEQYTIETLSSRTFHDNVLERIMAQAELERREEKYRVYEPMLSMMETEYA